MSRPTWTWASNRSAPAGMACRASSPYWPTSRRARSTVSSTAFESIPATTMVVVTDVLIYGDTIRSPELRHEVPVAIPDSFLYVERNGSRYVFVGSLEIPRIQEIDGLDIVPLEELDIDEL